MTSAIGVKRLYKSRTDKMVDGVCGGIAEYLDIDATLVRLAFVVLAFMGGFGVLLYIVAMIVMPANPGQAPVSQAQPSRAESAESGKFWGILLIVVGGLWFLTNVGVRLWSHWWHLPWGLAIPVLLIIVGAYLLAQSAGRVGSTVTQPAAGSAASQNAAPEAAGPVRRLCRSRFDKKVFGVCGGIAKYFDTDPTLVRILFIISAFASFGTLLLLYLIMAIIIPVEPVEAAKGV